MYNQQNYIQTLTDLLNITTIKIDEELDTMTLNNFSQPYSYQPDIVGSWPNRGQGRGGRNNAQVNRAEFNDNSRGGWYRNNQSNNWDWNKKRNHESSPEDDFPPNVNEYGDEL